MCDVAHRHEFSTVHGDLKGVSLTFSVCLSPCRQAKQANVLVDNAGSARVVVYLSVVLSPETISFSWETLF